jgi:hypothetical protein
MNRSLLTLLAAFVVLVGIYLVVKSSRDVTYHPQKFVSIDTARVDAIRLQTPTDKVLLKKKAGEWQVEQPITYPADSRLVRDMLSKLAAMEMETDEPLSQDPLRDTVYQVGETGTQVAIAIGTDTVANLIVGKMAPDSRHTFVRRSGNNNIYSVSGLYVSQLNRKVRDWRDKTILDIARDSINRIDLQWPNQTFSLVKVDSLWRMEGATVSPFDQASVEHLASAFYHFRTLEFLDGDSVRMVDFSRPDFTITVSTTTGKRSFSLLQVPHDENRFYLKRDDLDNTLFIIYKGTAGVYMKKPEDFKPKPPGPTQPAAALSRNPQQPSPEEMQEIMKKMKMRQQGQ